MHRRLRLALLLACAATLWAGAVAGTASAADPHELIASPPRLLLDGEPGTTVRTSVVFVNNSADGFRATVTPYGMRAATNGSAFGSIDASHTEGLPSWIELPAAYRARRVEPFEKLRVPLTIHVPDDATPGAHGATLVFTRTIANPGSQTDETTRVVLRASVAVQLVLTVPGDLRPELAIERVESPRWIWSHEHPRLVAVATNTGNTLLTVDGTIHISAFARRAARDLELAEVQMLPGGEREMSARWRDPPLLGWFRPTVQLDTGAGRVTRTFPTIFVLPPWWLIAAFVAAVALPVGVLVRRRRARRRRRPPR